MKTLRVGIVNAATPTPLTADGACDSASAKKLCRRWMDMALDGVLLLGSMGEGLLLSDAARNDFVETALQEAADRLTLFVSAADSSRARMLERARRYAAMGAHCVVLCLPPKTSVARAIADVKAVAEACPAPCAYYDTPENTGTPLALDEMMDVLSHPNIRVCKDSSNNALIAHLLTDPARRPAGVTLLDGVEYRTPWSRAVGYDGVLHGGGVLTGRWVRRIWQAADEGRMEEAVEMDRAKARFLAQVYNRFGRPLQNTAGQKYALKLLGAMDSDAVAVDQSLDDAARARVRVAVETNREQLQ